MPRTNIDYQKTIIYKIVCNDLEVKDCYVGHTTDFTKRRNKHKSNCNNENSKNYNYKVYQFIRENGGWNNWSIILIEYYPCKDGLEARARERYWYEILNANLNSDVPNRNQKEWCEDNKEIILEYKKEYRETNKEKITEFQKEYYKNNKEKIKELITCECGGQFQYCSKARHQKSKIHLSHIQSICSNDNVKL
jgi:hypothetical protein